jgi:hypothetical protein
MTTRTRLQMFLMLCAAFLLTAGISSYRSYAEDPKPEGPAAETPAPAEKRLEISDKPAPDRKDPNLKRMSPNYDVWIDNKNKCVVLEGTICRTEGELEMFACTRRTKEHESVVTVLTAAHPVHAALMVIGAVPGKPVSFDPVYTPATGTEIEIEMSWTDEKGNPKKCRAQDWIMDVNTKKAMAHNWVFAGSGFYLDETTGKRHYLADQGDFVCVSNFSSAMLDLPIKSTDQKDSGLLFDCFTANIPPKGTRVTMTLIPKLTAKTEPATKVDPPK